MIEEEIWKDIPGYEGYQASTLGRIRSYYTNGGRIRYIDYNKEPRILKPSISRGYENIKIKGKLVKVHRLVLSSFTPNEKNKPTVDHIDRVRTNNKLCNLRWASHSEQSINNYFKGESNGNSKLKDSDIEKIFELRGKNMTQEYISSIIGCHPGTISRILLRKDWKHIKINN
jgi:hypothetical protein